MTDQQLAQTLFVNDEGEVRSFPQHAGRDSVREAVFPKRPGYTSLDETVTYTETIWHPISRLPSVWQIAVARLYRERQEAREMTREWWHCLWEGEPIGRPFSERLRAIVERCRQTDWVRESER